MMMGRKTALPSSSSSSSSPAQEKQQQQQQQPTSTRRWSCETCRARKIKCDGRRPACGYCVKMNKPNCTFLGSKTRVDRVLAEKYEADMLRLRLKQEAAARGHHGAVSGKDGERHERECVIVSETERSCVCVCVCVCLFV
ncbi:hypothetical protein DFJ73DRAFT_838164, partial [Zopfochytrium polystomum]